MKKHKCTRPKAKKQVKYHELPSPWAMKTPMYLDKTDTRYKRCMTHLKKTGISYTETWSLDAVFTAFVLPRLKLFRKVHAGYPGCFNTVEDWNITLDKMIRGFQLMADDNYCDEANHTAIDEGLDLFRKYYHALWW